MADVKPNYHLEIQRLKMNIAAQKANIERQKLDILEMEDRKKRHLDNIDASEKALLKYNENLKSLEDAHT